MLQVKLIFSAAIMTIIQDCDSARILGVVITPSYSHQVLFQPIWKELSLKGHQVTVLTTDPVNDPTLTNLTEIDLHFTYDMWNRKVSPLLTGKEVSNPITMINIFISIISEIVDLELQHPEVQKLIKNKTEHFDLVMVEYMFPTMFAFAERFKCPSIALMSSEASSDIYYMFGNPTHPVLNPDIDLPFGTELTFFERLASVLYREIVFYLYFNALPQEQLTVEKHFGKNYHLEKTTAEISMLFANINPIFHRIRPLVPAVIPIGGGTHLQTLKPLPQELQKILDGAAKGFIYFSLGSNVKSKHLSEASRKTLMEVFAELPYIVLWKFELENMPGKPDNVYISKWFPQQDVLGHPNIRLFITQGGLQSMEEAILNHIPIIGMPFFGDQSANVKIIKSKGLGLFVDHEFINKESFKQTVLEVIENPEYRKKVKKMAELALDQPMTGLERAVWWTEYVLRHKGAKHLRSPALDIPNYQYYLLDVIGFCVLIISVAAYLQYLLVKLVFRMIRYLVGSKTKEKIQ